MKKLLLLLLPCLLAGCASTNGPAFVRLGVGTSAGYAVLKYPQARSGVIAGQQIVCDVAKGEDLSPVAVVAALDAAGVDWTPEAWFAVEIGVGAYNIAWNALKDPTTPKARPYLQAVCDGFGDALGAPPPATRARSLSRSSTWPQMR